MQSTDPGILWHFSGIDSGNGSPAGQTCLIQVGDVFLILKTLHFLQWFTLTHSIIKFLYRGLSDVNNLFSPHYVCVSAGIRAFGVTCSQEQPGGEPQWPMSGLPLMLGVFPDLSWLTALEFWVKLLWQACPGECGDGKNFKWGFY